MLAVAASFEPKAADRGLSVTLDGANSAASNTSGLNSYIPVQQLPLVDLATVAVLLRETNKRLKLKCTLQNVWSSSDRQQHCRQWLLEDCGCRWCVVCGGRTRISMSLSRARSVPSSILWLQWPSRTISCLLVVDALTWQIQWCIHLTNTPASFQPFGICAGTSNGTSWCPIHQTYCHVLPWENSH